MASGKTTGIAVGVVLLVVVIVISVVVAKCFMKLETSEVAITYDTFLKELGTEVYYEGLHMGRPTLTFIIFPSVFQTLSYSGTSCLNQNGVTVTLSVSLQYRIRPNFIRDIILQFEDKSSYDKVLRQIGSSAIHDACSVFNTTQFQTERGRFQELLGNTFVKKFDTLYTDVNDIQVNNINRPNMYENAIKSKESAREDIQVATNERPREEAKANTTKREALSEADIIINKALSEAKIAHVQAKAEAEAILNDYVQEAESYKKLKEANDLDNQGFLAYMGVRVISGAKNPVYVGMKGPAQTSFD